LGSRSKPPKLTGYPKREIQERQRLFDMKKTGKNFEIQLKKKRIQIT
jgi:hypothetical protein